MKTADITTTKTARIRRLGTKGTRKQGHIVKRRKEEMLQDMESESIKRELKDLDLKNEQLEIKLESKNSDAQRISHELLTVKTKYEKEKQQWVTRMKNEESKFDALEQGYKELERSIEGIVKEN